MYDHITLIRFSVQFTDRSDIISKDKLFTPSRLELRFELFEKYCLKSLVSQTIKNKVIVIYDKELPLTYLDRLKNLTKEYDFIFLHEWVPGCKLSENHFLQPYIDKSKKYLITTRMDDDDIIEARANEILYKTLGGRSDLSSKLVFSTGKSKGHFIYYEKNKLLLSNCNYGSPATFLNLLTPINAEHNIYFYDHSRLAGKVRVIHLEVRYGILNHGFNLDYTRGKRMKNIWKKEIKEVSLTELYGLFNLTS